ncbi:hypothetical protein DFJ77DRAFT_278018 [Powellomyces hirtus]|nr:hypothetical protein DFJ77DRAFT_278018 [Powellomyces hirtus]
MDGMCFLTDPQTTTTTVFSSTSTSTASHTTKYAAPPSSSSSHPVVHLYPPSHSFLLHPPTRNLLSAPSLAHSPSLIKRPILLPLTFTFTSRKAEDLKNERPQSSVFLSTFPRLAVVDIASRPSPPASACPPPPAPPHLLGYRPFVSSPSPFSLPPVTVTVKHELHRPSQPPCLNPPLPFPTALPRKLPFATTTHHHLSSPINILGSGSLPHLTLSLAWFFYLYGIPGPPPRLGQALYIDCLPGERSYPIP